MKLIKGALTGVATLALVAAPTLASAGTASKLSLRATTKSAKSSKAVPTIPSWLAVTLVGGVIAGAAIVATQSPEKPNSP